jgi:GNAT superfamily N-acetyltransferase
VLSKLRRNLREQGLRATAAKFAQRVREGYVRKELIVFLKDLDSIAEPGVGGDLRLEDLEDRHLSGISELNRKRGMPEADLYFKYCLAEGIHGFVALRGKEIVGYYHWVDCDTPILHPDLWDMGSGFRLEREDVYGSGLFLLEEHRGRGTASDFLFKVETSLHDRGYRRLWGYVDSSNRPARWLYSNRGYEPMWTVLSRRLVFHRWRRVVSGPGPQPRTELSR